MDNLQAILESGFDERIAKKLISYYQGIISDYTQGKWEESMSAGGKFAEIGIRALDLELFRKYKPFDSSLHPIDDKLLATYENKTGYCDSYRILIPRVLKTIYDIRNRRGIAHVSTIFPNEMDATLVLYLVKWVLAEIVRLKSGLPIHETASLVEAITERQTPLIWRKDDITRVIDTQIPVKDKILLLLNHFSDSKTEKELFDMTKYSNLSRFKKYLKELHQKALIEYECGSKNGLCTISPTGSKHAERIVKERAALGEKI